MILQKILPLIATVTMVALDRSRICSVRLQLYLCSKTSLALVSVWFWSKTAQIFGKPALNLTKKYHQVASSHYSTSLEKSNLNKLFHRQRATLTLQRTRITLRASLFASSCIKYIPKYRLIMILFKLLGLSLGSLYKPDFTTGHNHGSLFIELWPDVFNY